MNYEKEIFKHSHSEKTLAALSHSADIYKMQSCQSVLSDSLGLKHTTGPRVNPQRETENEGT